MTKEPVINFIDLNEITENDLIKTLDNNHRATFFLEEEIKKLKEVSKKHLQKKEKIKKQEANYEFTEEEKESEFELEVNYYLIELNKVGYEKEEILSVLPVRKNYNYQKIINRLRLEVIKNIKEIKELLVEEIEDLTKEEIKELREEIELENQKLKIITESLNDKKENTTEEEINNKIIFVPTTGGNIRVLEELKDIPRDYYEGFLGLFQSIKDGTFKGVERFASTNSALAGMCKLKDFKIRVVFERVDKDKYAVVTAFIKKSDNSKSYLVPLKKKVADYRTISSKIKSSLKNEEFLKENEFYEKELFRLLNSDEKESNDEKVI